MKRIALINQRYGLDVNGGSEYYTRLIAEKLSKNFNVEVLTTTALGYDTWENYYSEGTETIEGIVVHRFKVDNPRDVQSFNKMTDDMTLNMEHTLKQEQAWLEAQGPVCSGLLQYIKSHAEAYDLFVFVTYLYYLTVKGLPEVSNKAVLIPTAHDEPYIYFNIYKDVFLNPRGIIYLTDEEEAFVEKTFNNSHIPHIIAATGIDIPENVSELTFRKKYHIWDKYIIYVGRVDATKGCDKLFDYFIAYKVRHPRSKLKLVLMGKKMIEIPNHPDIINLGFVSDEDKYNGISGANALILPSQFESLSISVLEAMALKIPVIVNGKCEVLKGHCKKSNGGLYYTGYCELEGILRWMNSNPEIWNQMGNNARRYIDQYYQWEVIIDNITTLFHRIIEETDGENK
ncbi:MAG: glycosyltransferase [Clostridiales bacterium]|nr:glycosyltransferase [Clostridiales bacterium]